MASLALFGFVLACTGWGTLIWILASEQELSTRRVREAMMVASVALAFGLAALLAFSILDVTYG